MCVSSQRVHALCTNKYMRVCFFATAKPAALINRYYFMYESKLVI